MMGEANEIPTVVCPSNSSFPSWIYIIYLNTGVELLNDR